MNMKIWRNRLHLDRAGRVAVAVLVACGAMAVLAGPASAEQRCRSGPGYVTCFSLERMNNTNIAVHIGIDVHMSQEDAQAIINAPGEEFSAKVFGDDEFFDNALINVPVTWSAAGTEGLSAEFDTVASWAQLDEDNSYWSGYVDELYASIKLVDPRTTVVRTFNTAIITGYY
jgi:hypothetical protein